MVLNTKAESGRVRRRLARDRLLLDGIRALHLARGPRARAGGRRSRPGAGARRRCAATEAGSTGKIAPASTACRRPRTRSSWDSVPFSKNSSIRSSLLSATISTSFSRQRRGRVLDLRRARPPPRTCRSGRRGRRRPCPSRGRPRPRSPSPRPGGWRGGPRRGRRRVCSDSSVRSKDARSRSMRFTTIEAREAVLARRSAQTFSRLHLDPGHASTTTSAASATRRAERASDEEVRVAGRVEQVDLGLAPLAVGEGGLQADLALDLVGVEVGDGGAVVDAAEPVDGAHVEEHGGDQRRLAAAAVAHHGHVADAGGS